MSYLTTFGARPVQVTCFCVVLAACLYMFPAPRAGALNTSLKLLHLFAFAMHFGALTWVPFIGGMTMYHTFPRHRFGKIQSVLFPSYFTLGILSQALQLASFLYLHPLASLSDWGLKTIDSAGLVVSVVCCALNFVWLGPASTELLEQRNKIERQQPGFGDEVGLAPERTKQLKQENAQYKAISDRFGAIHSYSLTANCLTMCFNLVHLYALACALPAFAL